MLSVQEVYELIMQGVEAYLKPEGFKRSGRCFRKRQSDGTVRWSICFQKSRHSTPLQGKFTADVLAEQKRRPAHYEDWVPQDSWYGGVGDRIGFLMPKKQDTWWIIDEKTSPAILSGQITEVLSSYVLPFLRQFETESDIRNHWRAVANGSMKQNYKHALTILELDLLERKNGLEIEKSVATARHLGKINGVNRTVVEADIQRVLSAQIS